MLLSNCILFMIFFTGYMQSLIPEVRNTGVHTTTVYPGLIDTPLIGGFKIRSA